jgi:hypothetical protein
LEMNRLRCEDIVEATLVPAAAVAVVAAAAAASAYGVRDKIALNLSPPPCHASERARERLRRNDRDVKSQRTGDVHVTSA